MMRVISVRENPEYKEVAIKYFPSKWTEVAPEIYEDCITHAVGSEDVMPQCAGLITNDFISRMDLYPWLCALYIEEAYRGNAYAVLLIEKAKEDTRKAGFSRMYLSTEHVGYYEKYGFRYIGKGYHPWGENSRIYEIEV